MLSESAVNLVALADELRENADALTAAAVGGMLLREEVALRVRLHSSGLWLQDIAALPRLSGEQLDESPFFLPENVAREAGHAGT